MRPERDEVEGGVVMLAWIVALLGTAVVVGLGLLVAVLVVWVAS